LTRTEDDFGDHCVAANSVTVFFLVKIRPSVAIETYIGPALHLVKHLILGVFLCHARIELVHDIDGGVWRDETAPVFVLRARTEVVDVFQSGRPGPPPIMAIEIRVLAKGDEESHRLAGFVYNVGLWRGTHGFPRPEAEKGRWSGKWKGNETGKSVCVLASRLSGILFWGRSV